MVGRQSAVLALEDGSVFRGAAFGATKTTVGEAVFNTCMTGYQEIITDPSYSGQIVTMTTPHIGNYGIAREDCESDKARLQGLVVRELSPITSNWRSHQSLSEYLLAQEVPGITGVDTRAVTQKLRTAGALKACLSTEGLSDNEAIQRARDWPGLLGIDYVTQASCPEAYDFDPNDPSCQPFTVPGTRLTTMASPSRQRFRIVALDFGAKWSIFRKLSYHGFAVRVLPATATFADVCQAQPQGVFLSNGPGDPAPLTPIHNTVKQIIAHYPTFGICLGQQMITHALGAETFKLKFGHHGGNQPVKNLETGHVAITAQNHGFASMPEELERVGAIVTEINLNDHTVEGLRLKDRPVFSVQYHPEAAPGPNDAVHLFHQFYQLIATASA